MHSAYLPPVRCPSGGLSNMVKMFLPIDIISGLVLVAVETIVLVRWIRKRKAVADA